MAEPSENLTHPILGTLGWLSEYSHWFGQLSAPDGGTLDLVVDPGDGDRYDFLPRAAELFQWAMANERRVLGKAMRAELLELFNDTWRQEPEPELTPAELTARLQWTFLKLSDSEIAPIVISYAAGELFGGHSVDVEIGSDFRFRDVDLVG